MSATVVFAKSSGKADTKRLAVTGFCWGGFATWMYAAHNPALKAAVSWYGVDRKLTAWIPQNPAEFEQDYNLAKSVGAKQILFWEADYIDDRPNATALKQAMSAKARW